ncbi:MAG: beta-N-acetylhexosaminidase [Alphaproteobacteria bacterium]|nr:beta-N-acetylhexosaminidase [Alphaproteobacteria bacterium]
MAPRAMILGCAGLELAAAERAFFDAADPWGFILFARNIESPDQVRRLVEALRLTVGRPAPVFIDQEGGRVQRLRPPHWRAAPPMGVFGRIHRTDPARARAGLALDCRLIAAELGALGISADCVPCVDIPAADEHGIIGDRALSTDPEVAIELGRIVLDAMMGAGILPVIKHLPGHGRARVDSHETLPVVEASRAELEAVDFRPFAGLAHAPAAMTAHVVYTALDPAAPATTSPVVIGEVIRGRIGFDGLLMSDDLCMKALSGTPAERARAVFAAGCDIALHCNGALDEMEAIAAEAPALAGRALARATAAEAVTARSPAPFDVAEAGRTLAGLLAGEGRA